MLGRPDRGSADRGSAVRRLYRERYPAGNARELAFTVYAGVLVILCAVFPVSRAVVLVLTTNSSLHVMASPDSSRFVGLVGCALIAALVAIGGLRGPAATRPVFVWTVAGNDLPRHTALLPPFLRASASLGLLVSTPASLIAAALLTTGIWNVLEAIVFVAGAFLFAIAGSVGWLLGQFVGSSWAWLIATGILTFGALTALLPSLPPMTPWDWLAQLYQSPSAGISWLVALLLTAVACLVAAPLVMNRLRGTDLMAQSMRWESATVAGITGDLTLSLALFRTLPRVGRGWLAVRPGKTLATYWWRGLIGAFRTPIRMLGATLGLLMGNSLVAAAASTAPPTAAGAGGAVGALLVFLSLGPLSDGLRHAAEAAGAPALYGFRSVVLVPLMVVFPASVELGLALIPAAVVLYAGLPVALVACGSVAVITVLSRVLHSAKGPLPPFLLTPIPTPFGDLSGLAILAWQADALLLSALTGTVITAALAMGSAGLAITSTGIIAGTVSWLAIRRYGRR